MGMGKTCELRVKSCGCRHPSIKATIKARSWKSRAKAETQERERAKATLRWLKLLNSRIKKSSTRRKYATVLRARVARVFSSELTAGDKRGSEADREKGGAIAE